MESGAIKITVALDSAGVPHDVSGKNDSTRQSVLAGTSDMRRASRAVIQPPPPPSFIKTKYFASIMGVAAGIIATCAAFTLLMLYVNESQPLTGTKSGSNTVSIVGSGATFPSIVYWDWIALFTGKTATSSVSKVSITFNAVGSGAGINSLFANTSLFGASDSDLSATYWKTFLPNPEPSISSSTFNATPYIASGAPNHLGARFFPSVAGAIGISYNIPNLSASTRLIFSATVLGDIFAGARTMWNDSAIAELNPNVTLPAKPIVVVARSGSSGSTQVFTTYLSNHSSIFRTTIGISSAPNWPATFFAPSAAPDMVTFVNNLAYAIGYVPMDALIAGASSTVALAKVINSAGFAIAPTSDSISAAVSGVVASDVYAKQPHVFVSITDSPAPAAYPIALLTFLATREHYRYLQKPLPVIPSSVLTPDIVDQSTRRLQCADVNAMVEYMTYALTSSATQNITVALGWVPLSGPLLNASLTSLSTITCMGYNAVSEIANAKDQLNYYGDDIGSLIWVQSYVFWDALNKLFMNAPISSVLSILMPLTLFISANIVYAIDLKEYYSTTKKTPAPALPEKSNGVRRLSVTRVVKKIRLSTQNYLAVVASIITVVQLVSLATKHSIVNLDATPMQSFFSVISLTFGLDPTYCIFLAAVVLVWLFGLFYVLAARPFLQKHYSLKLAQYDFINQILALFLSNFATLFFTPVVEALLKSFNCRYNVNTNTFISSFNPINSVCWIGNHWVFAVESVILCNLFVIAVIRYSTIWKGFREKFDLRDRPWFVVYEPYLKCMLILIFENLPASVAFVFSVIASIITAALLLKYNPNTKKWYDNLRCVQYVIFGLCCAGLLIVEESVGSTNYPVLSGLIFGISDALIILLSVGILLALTISLMNTEILTATSNKKRRKEIDDLFQAISAGNAMGEFHSASDIAQSQNLASSPLHVPALAQASPQPRSPLTIIISSQSGKNNDPVVPATPRGQQQVNNAASPTHPTMTLDHTKMSMSHLARRGSVVSEAASSKFVGLRQIVEKLKRAGMLKPIVAAHILQEIKAESPLISHLFLKAAGNTSKFVEMVQLPFWKVCGDLQAVDQIQEEEKEEGETDVEEE